jgi:hypothetical protein
LEEERHERTFNNSPRDASIDITPFDTADCDLSFVTGKTSRVAEMWQMGEEAAGAAKNDNTEEDLAPAAAPLIVADDLFTDR